MLSAVARRGCSSSLLLSTEHLVRTGARHIMTLPRERMPVAVRGEGKERGGGGEILSGLREKLLPGSSHSSPFQFARSLLPLRCGLESDQSRLGVREEDGSEEEGR